MKFYNKIFLTGFILTVIFSALSFNVTSDNITNSFIRMHVIANSDSEYDQRIKMEVKESVSEMTEEIVSEASSIDEAEELLTNRMEDVEKNAIHTLESFGITYTAKAYMALEYFPTRVYDTFTLPAGEYLAVKVMLGEAEGENWWCVVYPSLCVGTAISDEVISTDEKDLIEDTPEISFKIYEVYMDIVEFFSA